MQIRPEPTMRAQPSHQKPLKQYSYCHRCL
uniref:Uncharacterized protein n=1 Tax=Rhizophora mucronata TaxID=61149 RepID=A0A2P2M9T5_RHIMU